MIAFNALSYGFYLTALLFLEVNIYLQH